MSENQKNNPLFIFGTGNAARVKHYLFTSGKIRTVVAFSVDATYLIDDKHVVNFEDVVNLYTPAEFDMHNHIDSNKMNKLRGEKYPLGYTIAANISSLCTYLSQYPSSDNCSIYEDNTLQPFVKIGSNLVLWSSDHTGYHSSVIEDHNFLTSSVLVSARSQSESYNFIGVNATCRDAIRNRRKALIEADFVILKGIAEKWVYLPPCAVLFDKTSEQI